MERYNMRRDWDEKAMATERTSVASVRVDLVSLATWCEYLERRGVPANSVNQAVSSALETIVDILETNGVGKRAKSLNEVVMWLDDRGLLQKRMRGRDGKRGRVTAMFDALRTEHIIPSEEHHKMSKKLHSRDADMVRPISLLDTPAEKIVERKEGYKERKTANNWIHMQQELTAEDRERLKEIWAEMTEEERFIVQKKVYMNNPEGEDDRWLDMMKFYMRFKPVPEEYKAENLSKEEGDGKVREDSDEWQEFTHDWFAKRGAFIRAMRGMIPELVENRNRLEFGEPIEGGERPVVNVIVKPYDITPEYVEEVKRREEENKANALKEKAKEKLIAQNAMKEAKKELGMVEEEQELKPKPEKKTQEEIEAEDEEKLLAELNNLTEEEEEDHE